MAQPIQLHPRIRERREPRISASALAEYIITPPDRQDDVLHDARFMRAPAVAPYSDAIRAIRAFCADPHRHTRHLFDASDALLRKSGSPSFRPSIRDEAARCVETIELFGLLSNAFGIGALALSEVDRFQTVHVKGVALSAQPDLIVGAPLGARDGMTGGMFIRPQKRPDPDGCKTEKTKNERQEFRREMARYMLVMLRLSLIEQGVPADRIDPRWLFVLDLRLRERVEFPSDRVSRERRIKSACGQIARLWATVEPRPGDLNSDPPA